jgi:hypothetical protein
MTLDGVKQAPGYDSEDTTGGFKHGGWHMGHLDDTSRRWVVKSTVEAGGFLLGRRTYEIFAAHWPNASEMPWSLAATTDENGDARPSSALIGACEPVSEIDAGAFPAPRTVCCEHAFQHRFLGWPCRAPPAQASR